MTVSAYFSLPHYAEHGLPIWAALPEHLRGPVYSPGRDSDWWGEPIPRKWPNVGPMIVASYADAVRVRPRPVIYVEHGAGQTYSDVPSNPSYSGGSDLHDVVLFVAPSETVAARWRARYPSTPVAVVGSPKLDRWHGGAQRVRHEHSTTVALSWHWECGLVPETRSAWPHFDEALPGLVIEAKRRGWRLLGHGHPRIWGRVERRYRELGIERAPRFERVLDEADVYVCDNSSTLWEFASLDLPIVVLDAPWYRRDVEHGLRFWEHADSGVRVSDPNGLVDGIARALDDSPEQAWLRRAASRAVYASVDGRAAERAAAAIVDLLGEPMPNPFAPRVRRVADERQSDVDALALKLRAVGASDDDIAEFREVWAEGDPDEDDRARLHELVMLDDATLRRMLAAQSGREVPDPVPEVDAPGTVLGVMLPEGGGDTAEATRDAGDEPTALDPGSLDADAERLVAGGETVRNLLAWVGGDPARAFAVERAERKLTDPIRSSLIDGLRRVHG